MSGGCLNRNMSKYLVLSSILSVLILLIIILLHRPIKISTEISSIFQVPLMFWLVMGISLSIIVISSFFSRSKYVNIFNSILFYFTLYSFNLFFYVIPTQSDIGSTRVVNYIFDNSVNITTSDYSYYEFPIFFTYSKIFKVILDLDTISWTNLGFFTLTLSIPLIFPLIIHLKYNFKEIIYFLAPSIYIIMSLYFINDQFMPQYLALIYLIIVIGCYIQFKDFPSIKIYSLIIFFYILCVYTHAFMFFFFFLGVLYYQIFQINWSFSFLKKINIYVNRHDTILDISFDIYNNFKLYTFLLLKYIILKLHVIYLRITNKKAYKKISIPLLIIIYYIGYRTRFHQMDAEFERMITIDTRGGSWYLLSYFTGNKESLGLISFRPDPLYHLIPNMFHGFTRYSSMLILIGLVVLIFYTIFKIKKGKIQYFDIFTSLGSFFFILIGFIFPHLLGQRSLQVTFINMSKYSNNIFNKENKIVIILIIILIISPIIFTLNININNTIEGSKFYEDVGTVKGGQFLEINTKENLSSFLVTDRNLFPLYPQEHNDTQHPYLPRTPNFFLEENNTMNDIDIILYTPKLLNRMYYYDFDHLIDNMNFSVVYHQGDSKIFYH